MIIESRAAEEETVIQVAKQMAVAARTAPKTRGIDCIVVKIMTGDAVQQLAVRMAELGADMDEQFCTRNARDAQSVKNSLAVVLIGTRSRPRGVTSCGFCGFADCRESQQKGGHCAFDDIDLGIALGSAVSLAADNRVDNRIMFSVGKTALIQGLLGDGVTKILGIPLSASGKNTYFDLGAFHKP